jgi:membrane protease YdiL (CAAX protease family)
LSDRSLPTGTTSDPRVLSGLELLLGTLIVVGHNVFRVLPNEVPILFVVGLLSIKYRNGDWSAMGLARPASWRRVLLIALAAALLRIVLGELVITPLAGHFWPPPIAPRMASAIPGNPRAALTALLVVWTFAAFGEEIAYRGYLMTRAADLGRRSVAAQWIGMVFVSALFGLGHYYKGFAGIVDSTFAGLILGSAYLLAGRNLWACILAHGLIDTVGVAALFLGFAS